MIAVREYVPKKFKLFANIISVFEFYFETGL